MIFLYRQQALVFELQMEFNSILQYLVSEIAACLDWTLKNIISSTRPAIFLQFKKFRKVISEVCGQWSGIFLFLEAV